VKGKTIGVLGLAFKPNTDDMRDAPSLDIIPALQAAGARVKAYDPESMHEAGKMLTGSTSATAPITPSMAPMRWC
jgi:UDPglucose 6-dehydrogenase